MRSGWVSSAPFLVSALGSSSTISRQMSAGRNTNAISPTARIVSSASTTCGTMEWRPAATSRCNEGHYYAIVDEVDSILIDEARTPLIISGPATVSTHQYDRFKPLVEQLVRKQTMLSNRLATEAKELYDVGKRDEAGRVLFKLKLGQPRNKVFRG